MAATSSGGPQHWARVWELSLRVIIPALLMWAIWVHAAVVQHDKELAVIQATTFTAADGRVLMDTILQRTPPPWLREDLQEIKAELAALQQEIKTELAALQQEIRAELADIKKRLTAVEAKILGRDQ
jgi:Skp family chaperone for outer membrane proteins